MTFRTTYTSAAGWMVLATIIAAAASLAVADVATNPGAEAQANPDLIELLSGVDFVPPGSDLREIATVQEIIDIARDDSDGADPGLRIRAYRALAEFPEASAEEALLDAIALHSAAVTGIETLYARAAMHSLAAIAPADDPGIVFAIAANLRHSSRDMRVSAAEALGVVGSRMALPALLEQLSTEAVTQVKLAIGAAIDALDPRE